MKFALSHQEQDVRLNRADHLEFTGEDIVLQKSPTADTRSAKEPVDQPTLLNSSSMHIEDVKKAMTLFGSECLELSNTLLIMEET